MKKLITALFLVLFIFSSNLVIFAETVEIDRSADTAKESSEEIKNEMEGKIQDIIPDEAKDVIEENIINDGKILDNTDKFNVFNFFSTIGKEIKKFFNDPLELFVNISTIILITAVFAGFKDSFLNNSLSQVIDFVSSAFIITIIVSPILTQIINIKEIIISSNRFMISFIPIFASLITASGKPVSSIMYSSALFSFTQFISFLIGNFLVPLLSVFLAFSVTSSINKSFDLSSITNGVKKCVTVSFGILITVFVSFLSLQGIVSTSSDHVMLKTGKFLVGNFIPVIGGALSDAVTSIYGYVNIIKNTSGVVGIGVIIFTFIPTIVKLGLTYLFIFLSSLVSDLLNINQVTKLLKSVLATISIMIAIISAYVILVTISFTLLLIIGGQ